MFERVCAYVCMCVCAASEPLWVSSRAANLHNFIMSGAQGCGLFVAMDRNPFEMSAVVMCTVKTEWFCHRVAPTDFVFV